jgi:outer membrane lipoprotein SlyB
MKPGLTIATVSAALMVSACVAGPGGANNAANRAVAGAGIGAALGGIAGAALGGGAFEGAAAGALLGGGVGAAMNPEIAFRRDTRGYCYYVDQQGNRVYDYSRRC